MYSSTIRRWTLASSLGTAAFALAACTASPHAAPPHAAPPHATPVATQEAAPKHDPHHGPPAAHIPTHRIALVPIAEWELRYPVAATELDEWARQHPEAMRRIASWDDRESDQVTVLTEWAADCIYEPLGSFVAEHHAWRRLVSLYDDPTSRAALEDYVAWARRNAEAANELVIHPAALRWAERHVVRGLQPANAVTR